MACRKMNEDVAYARNTESGCKKSWALALNPRVLNLGRFAYNFENFGERKKK